MKEENYKMSNNQGKKKNTVAPLIRNLVPSNPQDSQEDDTDGSN